MVKTWVKKLVKIQEKNVSGKYSQKLDHDKIYGTGPFKTASKRGIQKTAEKICLFNWK